MLAVSDEIEEVFECDAAGLGDLWGFGATPAHRDEDRIEPERSRGPSHLPSDRGLSGALADPQDRDRGRVDGRARNRRIQTEVRAEVGDAAGERYRGELHPFGVPEDGLVGQV